MTAANRISKLEERAISQRAAALALYALGGHDEQAMRLLDAADDNWRRVRQARRTVQTGRQQRVQI